MSRTLEELKEYIKENVDEVDLLELLNASAEDLVDRFSDIIEDKFDHFIMQLGLSEEDWDE